MVHIMMKSSLQPSIPDFFDESALPPLVPYDYPANLGDWNGLVLVGEAPGAEEARLGRPFVGRSGQLLDQALADAGIERKKCIVMNCFRVRPPNNKVGHFFLSRRAATLAGQSLALDLGSFAGGFCRADFAGELGALGKALNDLRHRRPQMKVVSLGRTALWALSGFDKLSDHLGKSLPCRLVENQSVIATYHPSFILRGNWGLKPIWIEHLQQSLSET